MPEGLVVDNKDGISVVTKFVGDPNVPRDVQRRRRSVYDAMRRFGTPVLIKSMLTDEDVENGVAQRSPVFDSVYGQTRNRDPISHGIGYVSSEKATDEWYSTTTGAIVKSALSPGVGYLKAPKYRGFGPGRLTYIIEPDRAQDFFKLTPQGVFIKVQTATAQAPWWPQINDNDLLINVTMKNWRIVEAHERYQARMTNPITVRGQDRAGRGERNVEGSANRYLLNQAFDMVLIPPNDVLYGVETDR